MEKNWKILHSENCPNCGDALEVFSEIPEESDDEFTTNVYDGEKVRCVSECGFESGMEVTEDGGAYVQEGNINDLPHK